MEAVGGAAVAAAAASSADAERRSVIFVGSDAGLTPAATGVDVERVFIKREVGSFGVVGKLFVVVIADAGG